LKKPTALSLRLLLRYAVFDKDLLAVVHRLLTHKILRIRPLAFLLVAKLLTTAKKSEVDAFISSALKTTDNNLIHEYVSKAITAYLVVGKTTISMFLKTRCLQ
jgi:hypothetical protein